jgi:hypothetical protein
MRRRLARPCAVPVRRQTTVWPAEPRKLNALAAGTVADGDSNSWTASAKVVPVESSEDDSRKRSSLDACLAQVRSAAAQQKNKRPIDVEAQSGIFSLG